MFNRLKRRIQENKDAKMFDAVTEELVNQTQYPNISPITGLPSEQPIKPEYPEMNVALSAIQPGNLITKLIAPSAYKSLLEDAKNGNLSQAMMAMLIPDEKWIGLESPELTKYHIGFDEAVPKFATEPKRVVRVGTNYENVFLKLPTIDQDNIIRFYDGEKYKSFRNLLNNKQDLQKFII